MVDVAIVIVSSLALHSILVRFLCFVIRVHSSDEASVAGNRLIGLDPLG